MSTGKDKISVQKFSMASFTLKALPTLSVFALGLVWFSFKFKEMELNQYITILFFLVGSSLYFEVVIRLGLLPNLRPPISAFIKLSSQDKIVLIISFMGVFLVVILANLSPTTDLEYLVMFFGGLAIYKFMGKWGSEELNSRHISSSVKEKANTLLEEKENT